MRYLSFLLALAISGCVQIASGEVGVQRDLKVVQDDVLYPGIHFEIPGYREIDIYSTQYRTLTEASDAATRDNQQVTVTYSVSWSRDPAQVPMQARDYTDLEEQVIPRRAGEAVKASVSKYVADALVQDRKALKSAVQESVVEAMAHVGVRVDNVTIDNLQFSKEYMDAVKRKVQARKDAERAEEQLRQTKAEAAKEIAKAEGLKQARILAAEGQAESLRIRGEILSQYPEMVDYMRVEKWDGATNEVLMVTGDMTQGGVVPMLEIASGSKN